MLVHNITFMVVAAVVAVVVVVRRKCYKAIMISGQHATSCSHLQVKM
jgi:hypothetical protein